MDEDDRGPRSTEEAYRELVADAARRLLSDPQLMPQPWNESRPDGWPISEAVFTFTPEGTRGQVSLNLGLQAEGYPDFEALGRLTTWGWYFLRQRLSRGELAATGIVEGQTEPRSMDPSLFDHADFDPVTGKITAVGVHYGAVRVFAADRSAPVAKVAYHTGAAGRPTPAHLARAEMQRRFQVGATLPKLSAEAAALIAWLEETHPSAPQIQPKSMADAIRSDYRKLCGKS